MWHLYVVDAWYQSEGISKVSQFSVHSKHETEVEAEVVAAELERLGYDCWIEKEGVVTHG